MPELLDSSRFRLAKLEDEEQVVMLRGWKNQFRNLPADHPDPTYPSDNPHAGIWGTDTAYTLVPSKKPGRKAEPLKRAFPAIEDRSGDAEVLVLASPALILKIITQGPLWCRARTKRAAVLADSMRAHRFGPGGKKQRDKEPE